VGPSWKPADDVLIYFNVAKGYKAGAFGTLPVIRPAQDAPVVQESVLAYEIGFKTAALAHRVELSGAAFRYDYDNKQLLASKNVGSPFGTLPALANIPRSRIEGAELDATVRPWRSFTLRAGGSYIDSKVLGSYVISSPIGGGPTPTIDLGGESFPATPKWQFDADAEYDHPISGDWIGFLGVGSTYQSTSQGTFGDIPSLQLPSYALLDLRIGASSRISTSNFGGAISRTDTTWSTLSARLIRSRAPRAFQPLSESRFAVLSDHARLAPGDQKVVDAHETALIIRSTHLSAIAIAGALVFAPRYARHNRGITNAQSADASNAQIRMNNGSRIVFAPHPAASYRVIISERRVPAKRCDILLTAHSRARSNFLLHDLRQRLSTKDIPTVAHAANHLGEVVRMREVVG